MKQTLAAQVDKFIFQTKKSVNYIKNIPLGTEHLHDEFNVNNRRHVVLFLLLFGLAVSVNIVFFSVKNNAKKASADVAQSQTEIPYQMKVLSLRYFPTDPGSATSSAMLLDSSVVNDAPVGTTVEETRNKVNGYLAKTIESLNTASKYHGYKDPNAPASLNYSVVDDKEFLIPVPKSTQFLPTADHFKMFGDTAYGINNICDYVDNQGVKEVWIWMYHSHSPSNPNGIAPVESNMAPKSGGTFGSRGYEDVSNSPQVDDLPRCSKSYVVYDFNYFRSPTLHTHGHHFERVLASTDPDLFGKFKTYGVGGNRYSCGTVHNPPNTPAGTEYIYNAEIQVMSDCQDWKPDGTGAPESVSCHTWHGSGACTNDEDGQLKQRVWWFQNFPGANNGITYDGLPMLNWWYPIANWDDFWNKKPVASVTSYANNQQVTGTINLTVGASVESGISKVEFYLDNQTLPFATTTSNPYVGQFDTTTVATGLHTFKAKIIGAGFSFGNSSEVSVNLFVNNKDLKPTVSLVLPSVYNALVTNNSVKFKFNVVGNAYNIPTDVADKNDRSKWWLLNIIPPNYETTLTLPDGEYYLSAGSENGINLFHSFPFKVVTDLDKDGTKDAVEEKIGTDKRLACGLNAWPPDVNNDKNVSAIDLSQVAQRFPPAPYDKRYDVSGNGAIDASDLSLVAKKVGQKCTITPPVSDVLPTVFDSLDCVLDKPAYTAGERINTEFETNMTEKSTVKYLVHSNNAIYPILTRSKYYDRYRRIFVDYRNDDLPKLPAGVYKLLLVANPIDQPYASDSSYYACNEPVTIY